MNRKIVKLVKSIDKTDFETKVKTIESYVNNKIQKAYFRGLKKGRS